MGQTTISVRMDDELKQQFDSVCNELGLSMSTAVTILARKMARRQGKTVTRTLDELDAMANE